MSAERKRDRIDYSTAIDDRAKMAEYLQSGGVRQIGGDAGMDHTIRRNRIVFSVIAGLLIALGLYFVFL